LDNHTAEIAAVASVYHLHILFSIHTLKCHIYQVKTGIYLFCFIVRIIFEIFSASMLNISLFEFQFNSVESITFHKSTLWARTQSINIVLITSEIIFADTFSQNPIIENISQFFNLIE